MKRIFTIITVLTAMFVTSCVKSDYVNEVNCDFKTNYEAFWNFLNENYIYFGDNYGYTKNVDWKKVYDEMMPQVENAQTEVELLEIMGKSIDYLKDGHGSTPSSSIVVAILSTLMIMGTDIQKTLSADLSRRSMLTMHSKPEMGIITALSQEGARHSSTYITMISPRTSTQKILRCSSLS